MVLSTCFVGEVEVRELVRLWPVRSWVKDCWSLKPPKLFVLDERTKTRVNGIVSCQTSLHLPIRLSNKEIRY